jgi:hypothetical protein
LLAARIPGIDPSRWEYLSHAFAHLGFFAQALFDNANQTAIKETGVSDAFFTNNILSTVP